MMGPPTSFPYHRRGSALTFPRDEGWHHYLVGAEQRVTSPALDRMEWVYLNAHLTEVGGQGRSFVVFAAYFTQHLRFLVVRAWDSEDRYLGVWTGSAFGLLTADGGELGLSFRHVAGTDRWESRKGPDGALEPFHTHLVASDDAGCFSIDLDLASTKAPYEAGGIGYLPFGEKGWFNYYSLTRLAVKGELGLQSPAMMGDAFEEVSVEGIGWFDHQWGPFFVTPLRVPGLDAYEWMSVQLDSGDELLLTTVWDTHGDTPDRAAYGGAGLIRSDGTFDRLVGSHRWQRTGFWRSPTQGAVYAGAWRFDAPEWGTSLVITPRHADQLTPVVDPPAPGVLGKVVDHIFDWAPNYVSDFWEGSCRVTGTFAGAPATGVAFAELVKRYADPTLHLDLSRQEHGVAVVSFHVKGEDPQAPLTYRATIEDRHGKVVHSVAGLDLPVLVIDDPELPRHEPLTVRGTAQSIDGTLQASASLTLELR